MRDLKPDENGQPTNLDAVGRIVKNESGKPLLSSTSWPNTGIGRLNLDGSLGSCSACHSRHDFSARRARQPENCGKCHLGPDHPQKEIYEESKHGVAFRDLTAEMNLDAKPWVLGHDYTAGADLRHVPHEREHAQRHEGDPRSGRAHLVDQPAAGEPGDGHRRQSCRGDRDRSREAAGGDRRYVRGEAQPHEAGVLALPHARLRQPVLPAVRRLGDSLQREVRQARAGDHERPRCRRPDHEDAVRRPDRVDVVLPLAPRGAAGAAWARR